MGKAFRNRVKGFLENHLMLYGIFRVIRNRKDKKYLEMVSLRHKPNQYRLLNDDIRFDKDRSVYIVSYNWETNGFFAIMRKCLSGCVIADSLGMRPYIYIVNSIFNVSGGFNGTDNMFEYYFLPLMRSDIGTILKEENCFDASYDHIMRLNRSFGLVNDNDTYSEYIVNDRFLSVMAGAWKRYFILNEKTGGYIHNSIEGLLKGRRVLGVHFRGTDFKVGMEGHPVYSALEDYYQAIDPEIEGYDALFIATDDGNALEAFKERYKDKVIFYVDAVRGEDNKGVHLTDHTRENDQYYLGLEVLRDMFTLSECDGLVAGLSQVSFFARIRKKSEGADYDHLKIIDKGIVDRGSKAADKYYEDLLKSGKAVYDEKNPF